MLDAEDACCSSLGMAVLIQAAKDKDTDWIFSEDPEVGMWVSFWCDVANRDVEDFQERCTTL